MVFETPSNKPRDLSPDGSRNPGSDAGSDPARDRMVAELTQRLRQQQLATEFANFGLATDELQPVLDEACRVAADGMDCRFAKVLEYLPSEDCFLMRAGIGWHDGVIGHARLGSNLASPAGYAFQTGQPVLSNELADDNRFRTPKLLLDHGIRRAFNVLVPTQGRHYGVLEVDSTDRRDFDILDASFMQNLAATLAGAIAKQARIAQLRRNKEFIEGILETSPDWIAVLDPNGKLLSSNANGHELLDVNDVSELRVETWDSLWPEDQRGKLRHAIAAACRGDTGRFDGMFHAPGGKPTWWDVLIAPLGNRHGQVSQLVAIARDITDRVAGTQAKDLLMLEVHHRVRNSLQLVQNLLALQGRASDEGPARDQLLQSAARVRTIAAIHDRLYKTGSATTVDVGPYLEGLVADLRSGMASTLENRAIEVSVDTVQWPAAEMPTLGLVVTELVTNALKYGEGTVRVTFRQPEGSHGVLVVSDEGTTLPDGFDPLQSRGLGMRLVIGMLRGESSGLEIGREDGCTQFIARMPPPRAFAP